MYTAWGAQTNQKLWRVTYSEGPKFTVWKVEKSSHLNEYNFVDMPDMSKIPFD